MALAHAAQFEAHPCTEFELDDLETHFTSRLVVMPHRVYELARRYRQTTLGSQKVWDIMLMRQRLTACAAQQCMLWDVCSHKLPRS